MLTETERQRGISVLSVAFLVLLASGLSTSAGILTKGTIAPAPAQAHVRLAQTAPASPLRVDELWRPELRRIPKGQEWVPKSDAPQFNSDPFKSTFAIPANAKITDGVSFSFDGRRLRLKSITSFTPREICRDPQGQRLACGALAKAKLAEQIYSGGLFCLSQGRTEEGTELVDCRVDRDETVQQMLVREGWAIPIDLSDPAFAPAIIKRCQKGNDRSMTQRLC